MPCKDIARVLRVSTCARALCFTGTARFNSTVRAFIILRLETRIIIENYGTIYCIILCQTQVFTFNAKKNFNHMSPSTVLKCLHDEILMIHFTVDSCRPCYLSSRKKGHGISPAFETALKEVLLHINLTNLTIKLPPSLKHAYKDFVRYA